MKTLKMMRWGALALIAVALTLSGVPALATPNQQASATPTAAATMEPTAEVTAEATAAPTMEATAEATVEPTAEATAEATMAATAAATRFPPCPNPDAVSTEAPTAAATEASTEAATAEGTAAATQPADFKPGYLGIAGETVDECGTKVTEVVTDSPAEKAGVLVDDVIVAVDNMALGSVDSLRAYITTREVGASIEVVLRREGEEVVITVTLGERPTITPPTVLPTATN